MSKVNLPRQVTIPLYVYYKTESYRTTNISIVDFDSTTWDKDSVLLAEIPFVLDLSELNISNEGITRKIITQLEQKKSDLHAEYHVKIRDVQDEINEYLSLEYKPSGAIIDADYEEVSNDIPF